jgi:hypothetical protein
VVGALFPVLAVALWLVEQVWIRGRAREARVGDVEIDAPRRG